MIPRDILFGFLVAAATTAAPSSQAKSIPQAQSSPAWENTNRLPRTSGWTAADVENTYRAAIESKRAEIRAIAASTEVPTFENTIAALDRSGDDLARAHAILTIYATTKSNGAISAAAARIAALRQALEDETAQNRLLFDRVDTVFRALPASALDEEARQLTMVTRAAFVRQGALLDAASKTRLTSVNAQLAVLQQRFAQNLARDEVTLFVEVTDEAQLAGIPEADKAVARAAAVERGTGDRWVIRNTRPAVWSVAKYARDRVLRAKVWQMWMSRGDQRGETDNRPVTRDILRLRGEQASLLGYPNFAVRAFDGRMVAGPKAALQLLMQTWKPVYEATSLRLAEMQKIADRDKNGAIRNSDWLYYGEQLRRQRFAFDSKTIQPYFQVPKLLEGMMWAAERTYGFTFEKLGDADVVSPDIEVFRVRRRGHMLGVLYVDLYRRDGKQRGSWASQYQVARAGSALPIVALHSNAEHSLDGRPAVVDYEVANVVFHEFGHVLHTLSSTARFAGTGSTAGPWDFVETPSLLNERWLLEPEVLSRVARHRHTGLPMPAELADKLRQVVKFDRVFSVNLDYLATAIVDLRLHLLADGRDVDVAVEEAKVLKEIGLPDAIDPTLRALHASHTFSPSYAAGVYTYLWSDMLAADLGAAFQSARGGLFDRKVADRYFDTILSQGAKRPVADMFRSFRGRDPDPGALFRRFGLPTK